MDKDFTFKSEEDFESWLSEHHDTSNGIWVRLYKKNAHVKAIKNAELIDVLLCYGWITGPAKKGNEQYVLWWACPRKRSSMWSKINIDRAKALIKDKRMQPAGFAEINKAMADGKWH